MRAVVQRVISASCEVNGEITGRIEKGLLVFLGVGKGDDESDIDYIVDKVVNLRVFEDGEKKMNLSVRDIGGSILLVSQFTLMGDARKGRRPSFDSAMSPAEAEKLYERTFESFAKTGIRTETGRFREMMKISLINDGPVTILLDSKRLF
ncbi:MAG: D-aminoacyl-tRNA deacylase [Deltaproteobacteria bacterium]|nr:D-aminoacyl-tRNA deacylase [Deltaproteobacteria bacterium]